MGLPQSCENLDRRRHHEYCEFNIRSQQPDGCMKQSGRALPPTKRAGYGIFGMAHFRELSPFGLLSEDKRRDVIVIGAGVVGLSSALWLQRAGHRVTIVDRAPPLMSNSYEHACTFGNATTIAFSSCIPVATPGIIGNVPKMLLNPEGPLSIVWRDLPQLVPWLLRFLRSSTRSEVERITAILAELLRFAEAGHATLIEEAKFADRVRRGGCLYVYTSEKGFASARTGIDLRRREGVRMMLLDPDDIREREPSLAPSYYKGVLFHDSYNLDDPHGYARGLASAFESRGGTFIKADVRAVTAANDTVSVVTPDGIQAAQRIVIAGGAWSKTLAAQVGDNIRLGTERGYHVLFPDCGHLLSGPTCFAEQGFFMTPLSEGLRAAGTVELGGLGKPLRPHRTHMITRVARRLLPGLTEPSREWLGFRPSMPDSLPVIGPSPRDPRFIYAFGHGHIGLTLGGITGRLVADIVSGRTPAVDLAPLRPDRFN